MSALASDAARQDGSQASAEAVYGDYSRDPMISLQVVKEAARRRWGLWVGLAVAGFVVGAALHFIVPPKYSAYSDMYLVEPGNVEASDGMNNDVSLLETTLVAERAVESLGLSDKTVNTFSYQGSVQSNVILGVQLSARTRYDAVAYLNALDGAFLAVRAQELEKQTSITIASLNSQVASLNDDVQVVTSTINALSSAPAGAQSASEIAGLVNQRSADETQITALQSDIQSDLLDQTTVIKGSQVLDAAQGDNQSTKKEMAEDALSGLAAGLALGLAVVVIGAIVSDRPRRRDLIAAALGAPVELSLRGSPQPRLFVGARLRKQLRKPGPEVQMAASRLRVRLNGAPNSTLAVVEVGAGPPAALAVGWLAMTLASEAKRVLVADMADHRPLSALFGAHVREGTVTVSIGAHQFNLFVAPRDPVEIARARVPEGADAVLVLTSEDPAIGADHVASWAQNSVVVLTAGAASTARITATREMLRHAGIAVTGAVLFGADRKDESLGSLEQHGEQAQDPLPAPRTEPAAAEQGVEAAEAFGAPPLASQGSSWLSRRR